MWKRLEVDVTKFVENWKKVLREDPDGILWTVLGKAAPRGKMTKREFLEHLKKGTPFARMCVRALARFVLNHYSFPS